MDKNSITLIKECLFVIEIHILANKYGIKYSQIKYLVDKLLFSENLDYEYLADLFSNAEPWRQRLAITDAFNKDFVLLIKNHFRTTDKDKNIVNALRLQYLEPQIYILIDNENLNKEAVIRYIKKALKNGFANYEDRELHAILPNHISLLSPKYRQKKERVFNLITSLINYV